MSYIAELYSEQGQEDKSVPYLEGMVREGPAGHYLVRDAVSKLAEIKRKKDDSSQGGSPF